MHTLYSQKNLTTWPGAVAPRHWLWLLLLALLPLNGRASGLHTGQSQPSLATALLADGTLRPGINGAFDAHNFTFSTAPDGRPVFRPTGTTGAGDYKWQDGFGLPEGINSSPTGGNVKAVLQVGSDIYIGGNFTAAGGTAANYIAKWNGTAWSSLGTGPANGMDYYVRALAVAPNGDLYAGGDFTRAGGVAATGIARWNGSSWSAVGGGIVSGSAQGDGVYALAISPNGDVYAGGSFYQAGTTAANGLARWNGTTWSTVGGGLGSLSSVSALALDAAGNLYVGGNFARAGGVVVSGIARWNGTSWNNLGGGMRAAVGSTSLGQVYALAVAPNGDVYAGGDFEVAGGQPANYIARWNGTAWSGLGTGVNSRVYGLALSPAGDVYVSGYLIDAAGGVPISGVARWNGTAWSSLGSAGGTVPVYGYCLLWASSGDLYAGGDLYEVGGTRFHGIGRWNGTAWTTVGTSQGNGVYGPVQAVAVAANGDVYVGGSFNQVGNVPANNVAKWNGTNWSALGMGTSSGIFYYGNGSVDAMALAPNGDLYIGGLFTQAGGLPANNVARWNGTTWSALISATGSNGLTNNAHVYALAVAANGDLYAGGGFSSAGGMSATNVAKWNGTTWSALGSGINSNYVTCLAVAPNGDVYAGSYYSQSSNYLMRWNGAAWRGVGSGLNGGVTALAVASNGDLYVGGVFTLAGGTAANYVARWNGAVWSPLGTGAANGVLLPGGSYPGVNALAFGPAGELYVGGNFTRAGGNNANYLATWNGTAWSSAAFGTGLNNTVRALGVMPGGKLCVGGFFAGVGDTSKPSVAFGIFNPSAIPTATVAGKAAALSFGLYPNPARSRATVQLVAVPSRATLTVLDALGRTVRSQVAATNAYAELDLADLAPGLYTVQVQVGSYSATQRLVVE